MTRQRRVLLLGGVALLALSLVMCTSSSFDEGSPDGAVSTEGGLVWPEAGAACRPGQDQDMDQIPDDVEGCNRDSDNDMIPDYNDTDSDNDKVLDGVEAGINKKKPVDSDGDKTPDYRDNDSDNDGIKDGDEDLNGDGKLGCCLTKCGEARKGCPTVKATECGIGQKCTNGSCSPLIDFLCANGETDPRTKSTFGGGKTDKDLPTFICRTAGEQGTSGLKTMKFRTNTSGGWKLALEPTSNYGDAQIRSAGPKDAAAYFDLQGTKENVAGFIVSMPTTAADVNAVHSSIMQKLHGMPNKGGVTMLSSGSPKTSHDSYPTIVSSQVQISSNGPMSVSGMRNAIVGHLVGKQLANLPADFGAKSSNFRVMFQTLLRKDGRALMMGGVGTDDMARNPSYNTGLHLDDLSNGTGLADTSNSATVECDPFRLSSTPKADIVWIVDESGSMNDNRQDVANNAKDFFARAVKSGLDFRIAVTNVCSPKGSYSHIVGKFCSVASSSSSHDGGPDRFLSSTEQSIFEACVKNPPGYEGGSEYGLVNARDAVTKHLPRAANNPSKIRPDALLVLIVATDELPNSLYYGGVGGISSTTCTLDPAKKTAVQNFVKKDVDLYLGKDPGFGAQGLAIMHVIGGVCNNTCRAYVAHGYNEVVDATKGTKSDVCQKNLGQSMQIIINSITGASSPAKLQYVPISASVAVAVDKTKLARSRISGFDYVSSSNTLVFIGVPFPKGSMVVASYRRWVKQAPIE